ncbi:hypothetical protein C8255_04270 [filamentous cyanobacterium CCP3]|nr:hypothetical protein C8255_04270 [filamentous cyanobacterium CCP3]
MTSPQDLSPSRDRLYQLLPAIYRHRDAEVGEPLRSLLQVISEQVDLVEADIDQLYRNWFIETCEDWAVPYIADLIGYRSVAAAGTPGDIATPQGQARNRVLIPRREVANTLRYRRRKGTLALLELLAHDVAGWPARAVEFYRLLGINQGLNHLRPDQGRTVDLRQGAALLRLNGPFDAVAHTAEVRRIAAKPDGGRYNLPNAGLFVWRLRPYPVTQTPAYCREEVGPHCYTFSVLGNDTALYTRPEPETEPTHIADELNLPVPIRRRIFEVPLPDSDHEKMANPAYYGEGKSLTIWAPGWHGSTATVPIPADRIVPADLSGWQYRPVPGKIAVDPELGRIAFPPGQLPRYGVVVSYHYGFSADVGGGEYDRDLTPFVDRPLLGVEDIKDVAQWLIDLKRSSALSNVLRSHLSPTTQAQLAAQDATEPPAPGLIPAILGELNAQLAVIRLHEDNRFVVADLPRRLRDIILQEPKGSELISLNRALLEIAYPDSLSRMSRIYRVRQTPGADSEADDDAFRFNTLTAAVAQWQAEQPRQAAIEIEDSGVYVEQLNLEVRPGQSLHIRAANHKRPVLRLLNWYTAMPDAVSVVLHPGSHLLLDGLMVTGRGIRVSQVPETGNLTYGETPTVHVQAPVNSAPKEHAYLAISHCTLVPGWGLEANCDPRRPAEPSLELTNFHGKVLCDRTLLGSIQLNHDEVETDPVAIEIRDSLLDATSPQLEAIGAPGCPVAHATLRILRSTVFGQVQAHAIELAENSIFEGKITVARSQIGCMRFCAYLRGSRTPRRFRCQPDLAIAAAEQALIDQAEPPSEAALAEAQQQEEDRVRPRFSSTRYGTAAYGQLSLHCPTEITRGADDESEMGVFHHLFQPQRAANLEARLNEFVPSGMSAAILYAN